MPYNSEKIIIAGTKYDKRIKLSDEDRKEIVSLYKLPEWSQRKLAKKFGVSRRLIQFILDPEKHQRNLERRKETGGSKQYYDKDKWREEMKKHRKYKQELHLKGLI